MMKHTYAAGAFCAALVIAGAASAASVTVEFPSATSTTTASAGEFFFTPTHTVTETFLDTGVDGATKLELSLNIDSVLNSGAFVDLDVLLNGDVVGSFTHTEADGDGVFDFSFMFLAGAPLSDDYTIAFAVTNTVAGGQGSIDFIEGSSFATLSNDMAAVPAPPAAILLLTAIAGLAYRSRRKAAA